MCIRDRSNTVERSYPSVGEPRLIGLKTMELPDGSFLIAGSRSRAINHNNSEWFNLFLIKTDKNGFTLWSKEISTVTSPFRPSNHVLITPQNEILVLSIESVDSIHTLNIKKFDFDGNEILSTNLISDSTIFGSAIISLKDDSFMITYGDNYPSNPISILKIDTQLNIIWHKKIMANYPSGLYGSFSINKWGSNDFVIGFKTRMLMVTSEGEEIFILNKLYNFISETETGGLIISGNKTLTKLDSSNNVVWTRNFLSDPGPAIQTSDGNYLVNVNSYPDSIIKIDESGNLLWKKPVLGNVYNINENYDGALLFSGILFHSSYNYNYNDGPICWILKTDFEGNYNSINLITPIGYENILTFNNYTVGWHSNGVERVNLFLSLIHISEPTRPY